MYSEKLESLIEAIIADGEIEESEMAVLKRAAEREGEDPDELEIVVKGRLAKMQKTAPAAPAMPQAPDTRFGGPALKCPACGALYVAGSAACPECGYAFTGITSTRSSERLYQQLLDINKQKTPIDQTIQVDKNLFSSVLFDRNKAHNARKDDIVAKFDVIQAFPVPNSREDLLDFITAILPKANPHGAEKGYVTSMDLQSVNGKKIEEDLSYAYWLLVSNCINKARVSFAGDEAFALFIQQYEAKQATPDSKKKKGFFGGLFGK